MPISSQKSYLGHTLGACGALEAWFSIEMMKRRWFAPTLNLENVDAECAPLDYIRGDGREIDADIVVSNNFAFGGINTSFGLEAILMSDVAGHRAEDRSIWRGAGPLSRAQSSCAKRP